MGVACVTLRFSLRKGRYIVHLKWDSTKKSLTEWSNIYESGVLVMGDIIFEREGKKFTDTACTTRSPWFGKFTRIYNLQMGVIK